MIGVITRSCVRVPRSDAEEALSLDQHGTIVLVIADGDSPLRSFLVLVTNVFASKKSQDPRALLLVVMKKDSIERTHSVLLVLVLSRIKFIKWLILMMLILVKNQLPH